MDIKGAARNGSPDDGICSWASCSGAFYASNVSTALSNVENTGGSSKAKTLNFQASKKWTGSTSEENSHTHSFSSSATIGSGNYTRPNSTSCKFYIKY